jgi:hypothetical protein
MASDLGRCYARSESGFYRLYKVDGLWAIYLVSKIEGIEGDATFGGYISDPMNFEYGIEVLKENAKYL